MFNMATGVFIKPAYDQIDPNDKEGLHKVRLNDQYGYVNNEGELVLPIKYASAYEFDEGKARVKDSDDGKAYYIDKSGNVIKE